MVGIVSSEDRFQWIQAHPAHRALQTTAIEREANSNGLDMTKSAGVTTNAMASKATVPV